MNFGNCIYNWVTTVHRAWFENRCYLYLQSAYFQQFFSGGFIHTEFWTPLTYLLLSRVTLYLIPFPSFSLRHYWCVVGELVSQSPQRVYFYLSADVITCRTTHSNGVDKNGNCRFVWLHIIVMSFSASTNHILKFNDK